MTRPISTLCVILLSALALTTPLAARERAGPKDPKEPKGATVRVVIQKMRFTPPTLTVRRGDTVTWVNKDQHDHTVDAADDSFSSGTLNPGESFSHKFTKAGTIKYACSLHPRMRASLTVE